MSRERRNGVMINKVKGIWGMVGDSFREDISAFLKQEFEFDPRGRWILILKLFFVQGFWAVSIYRFGSILYSRKAAWLYPIRIAYFFLYKLVETLTGVILPPSVKAGKGLYIGHFGGIIINDDCEIGEFCKISPGVIFGTKGSGNRGVPKLGNNVYVGAGAKVIGPITIGNNVVIGANAVVLKNVPDNVTVAGIPAKIVRQY